MRRKVLVLIQLSVMTLALLPAILSLSLVQQGEHVDVIKAEGVIDPVMARYVSRAIATAQRDGTQCLIIQLDTPGGLDSSMRAIVQEIMNSAVPIVVYVSPAGARAASAGVFITLAAHIAAMAPSTNIGAAHPVGLGGELTETMAEKITNDAAAYIRSIASERGRNAAWAEEAVRKSVSITEQEALQQGVIDLVAENLTDLLEKLEGRTASTTSGDRVLQTEGAAVKKIDMSLPEKFLHIIVDPNIAYILLTLGIYALIAEFYHPGMILPGVTGVILLILAFVAFGSLPINWGGLALIILAIILFILDTKVAGFALSVGGAIAFALGSLILFEPFWPVSPAMPRFSVNPWLIAAVTSSLVAFFIFVISAVVRTQRAKLPSGVAALVGAIGVATSDLAPTGTVLVQSESWTAEAVDQPIKAGEEVIVVGIEGIKLKVSKREIRQ